MVDPYASHNAHSTASPAHASNDGASPVNTINPSAVAQRSASSTDGSLPSPAHPHARFLEPLPHLHRQPSSRPSVPGFEGPRSRPGRGSPRLHSLPTTRSIRLVFLLKRVCTTRTAFENLLAVTLATTAETKIASVRAAPSDP